MNIPWVISASQPLLAGLSSPIRVELLQRRATLINLPKF